MPDAQVGPFSSPLLGVLITTGNLAVWIGLLSAVLCVVFYWVTMIRNMRRPAEQAIETEPGKKGGKRAAVSTDPYAAKTERWGIWARRLFYATGFCFFLGAICLWTLILRQEYTVQYIWKNSNSHLNPFYRFASFWGDQDGTFFLWGMYNTIIGGMLLWNARQDERWGGRTK